MSSASVGTASLSRRPIHVSAVADSVLIRRWGVPDAGSTSATGALVLNRSPDHGTEVLLANVIIQESPGERTPLCLSEVPYGNRLLRFREPLTLQPKFDESEGLYTVENELLGILVFAYSRAALVDELYEEIWVLWDEYACERDENLAASALDLKRQLLDALEEVESAEG